METDENDDKKSEKPRAEGPAEDPAEDLVEDLVEALDGATLARAFDFTDEKRRALHGLRGILAGVVADRRLNEKELLYLDVWLKSQQFLSGDQEVVRLLRFVGKVLETGRISGEQLEETRSSIESFLGVARQPEQALGQISELYGFLTGVASDGVLNDSEIRALSDWLERHLEIQDRWPASVILNRVRDVLEDGLITEDEREDLMDTLQRITGGDSRLSDLEVQESIAVWEDPIDSLCLGDATFCLTGNFVSGNREAVENLLRLRGADISPGINRTVDYLVIGTLASRDWLYTAHGRKIEKVLLLRLEGSDIRILTERSLFRHL